MVLLHSTAWGYFHDRNFLTLGIQRNYPAMYTKNSFRLGDYHPSVDYGYAVANRWMLNVRGQFKLFEDMNHDGEYKSFPLFNVSQEVSRIYRIYHPNYLLLGVNLHYFLPVNIGKLPIKKNSDFEAEVGLGLSLSWVQMFDDYWGFKFRVERWRGLNSMKYHGIEGGMGLIYRFL